MKFTSDAFIPNFDSAMFVSASRLQRLLKFQQKKDAHQNSTFIDPKTQKRPLYLLKQYQSKEEPQEIQTCCAWSHIKYIIFNFEFGKSFQIIWSWNGEDRLQFQCLATQNRAASHPAFCCSSLSERLFSSHLFLYFFKLAFEIFESCNLCFF